MTDISERAAKKGRRAKTEHGEVQRRALVQEAYLLIAEGGFERLRTREVASRAGVNTATLHYYFATKEDLIRGVVERLFEELSKVDASRRGRTTTPLEELREEFDDLSYQLENKPETYVVLYELTLRSLRDETIRDMLTELDARWSSHIEGYLSAGVQQGIFRSDLDIPAAVAGLMAFAKGSILQSMNNPQAFPADRAYAEMEYWITGQAPSPDPY